MLLLPAAVGAYELKTDASGATVSFGGKEMVFELPDAVPSGLTAADVKEAAEGALAAWSAAARLTLSAAPADGVAASGSLTFVEESWPYDANAVAVTVLQIDQSAHQNPPGRHQAQRAGASVQGAPRGQQGRRDLR